MKSVIDYILVNRTMYSLLRGMEVDEEKTYIDISDHNLLQATFYSRISISERDIN